MALTYLRKMFSLSLFAIPDLVPWRTLISVFLFIGMEWLQREKMHGLEFKTARVPRAARWAVYAVFVFVILIFGGKEQEFIYFQF